MTTVTSLPTQQSIEEKRRAIKEVCEQITLSCRQTPQPHNIINPGYGGSDQLLADILELYGTYTTFFQEFSKKKSRTYPMMDWETLGYLLKWVARRLGHAPTEAERLAYKALGVLPDDSQIEGKFGGRKDFAAIYRIIGLPKPGDNYSASNC